MKTCKIVYNTSFTKDSTKIIVRTFLKLSLRWFLCRALLIPDVFSSVMWFFPLETYHFRLVSFSCEIIVKEYRNVRTVIWRVIRITGLWAYVVFAWNGRFLIFYSMRTRSINSALLPPILRPFSFRYIFSRLLVSAFTSFTCFIHHTLNLYCY